MAVTINIAYRKNMKLDEFERAVCGLFNTDGGFITLYSTSEATNFSEADVDGITRSIEQKVSNLVDDFTATDRFKRTKVTATEISFHVQVSEWACQLCTMDYNLYYPSESQVKKLSSTAPLEKVIDFIEGKQRGSKCPSDVLDSHHRRFVFGEALPFRESKDTQFKKIKCEKSKHCDLASRITNKSNKLIFYVSAFANFDGGHIYYGVNNETNVVEGEIVTDEGKITKAVERAIKKMLWPKDCGEPKRGMQWDIFFEPVLNVEGEDAKFVIVVSVNPSPRAAVFAEKPEGYKEVGGKVVPLEFLQWKKRLLQHRFSKRSQAAVEIRSGVGHCGWSSSRSTHEIDVINDNLVQLRNDGKREAFEAAVAQLLAGGSINGKILSQQQQAGYLVREGNLDAAEKLLAKNEQLLRSSKDGTILEARWLYWMCVVKRLRPGKLREGEELFTNAIQKMQLIPPSLVGPWLFVQKARILETKITKECAFEEDDDLIKECKACYIEALREAAVLKDSLAVVALKQRVHISLARVCLGSFRRRKELTRKKSCEEADREAAEKMLEIVDRSCHLSGWPMAKLCKCEYRLVRSEQDFRNWEEFGNLKNLKSARKKCAKVLKIAKEINFNVISGYASAQLTHLDNQLKEINEQEELL